MVRVKGGQIMHYQFDWEKYSDIARQAAAEGCVLLKNDNNTLPINKGETVSVFGRIQFNYYYSGTGSGGMVNPPYVVSILDALKASEDITINQELLSVYEAWTKENPFDMGKGWAQEPWCQKEMPLTKELVEKASRQSDIAVVIIGRTAGEDKDNSAEKGSYLLTDEEDKMLELVCSTFSRVAVLLNVGNVIDMEWIVKYNPQAVLYVWQGGCEGGNGVCDILTGKSSPSGKLVDTIACNILDYPAIDNFGDSERNYYKEDIYVGYRYFETAAKEKVRYPFGYGLSYTTFEYFSDSYKVIEDTISFNVTVKNTGSVSGKQVIQAYACPPQGSLGKPSRSLIRFAKTKLLNPGESETISFEILLKELASYDDSGATNNKSSYVLEEGLYEIYVGFDVRNTSLAGNYTLDKLMVVEKLQEALAPTRAFSRLKPREETDGSYSMTEEKVPLRTINLKERLNYKGSSFDSFTDDKGYKLKDVYEKKVSLPEFLGQLSDHDLVCMSRGEGMCSPKVTPGTAGAFGGITDKLKYFGIPAACCADGPSGIRMDDGSKAFSLPNGTALASSFNVDLIEKLFEMVGMELRKNKVDTILGPGMNIHRCVLNGRNFEYFSEDPYVTGKIAAAELKGMHKYGVTGTIKHFACNNQEFKRTEIDSIVSERALREIYLKGFEIAVKEGGAYSVMTSYGAINGIWTAGNFDLLNTVLRNEWKFSGIVMTDWWAKMNDEGCPASSQNTAAMIRAQNDLFMVTANPEANSNQDNAEEELKRGNISRGQLVRNAINICSFVLNSPAMKRFIGEEQNWSELNAHKERESIENIIEGGIVKEQLELEVSNIKTEKGSSVIFDIKTPQKGEYSIKFKMKSDAGEVSQMPLSIFINNHIIETITINGTNGKVIERKVNFYAATNINNYIKLYFGESGIEIIEMKVCRNF
ncbi:glycosyl hydrolase family 3 protein [Clostridiales bacterium oral taxon 876 str. F0540]|nr:glycosyl hydrolase family 3 protein [Clostridiales bacterium oral taxon 876 str. F0540]